MTLSDFLLAATDPLTALLLGAILYYVRGVREDLRREIGLLTERINRLESRFIGDGGEPHESE